MKIISFILAASLLLTSCFSKHKAESGKNSASSGNKKTENTDTEPAPPPAVDRAQAQAQAQAKDMYKCTAEVSMKLTTSPGARTLMKIMKGESVELLEKVNADWWKIKYRDESGYANPKNLAK